MMILGHRGVGTKEGYPENTLAAFAEAMRQGADGIEFDVRKTSDGGDLVISHSPDVAVGAPSLRDVFNLMSTYTPPPLINIELKGPDTYALAQKQARDFCAQTGYPYGRIVFSSFDHQQLMKLRHIDDDACIGVLFGPTYGPFVLPLRLYPETGLSARRKPLTEKYMTTVMETIKPTSIHAAATNLAKAKSLSAKYSLDLYIWASYGEGSPDKDRRIEKIVRAETENPHLHVITNYPAAMAKIRQ